MKSHNIIKRWKAPTPAFFKKIIAGGLSLGAICTGVMLGLPQAGIEIPETLNDILTAGVAAGIIASVVAKVTADKEPDETVKK